MRTFSLILQKIRKKRKSSLQCTGKGGGGVFMVVETIPCHKHWTNWSER